jgi:phosphotriesterase-related protein
MKAVRTVLGDVEPGLLGVTDAHDHLFLASRALPGEELDDRRAAEAELRAFHAAGGQTLVQWSPRGLGRRQRSLSALSRRTGVQIVGATGLHQARHYTARYLAREMPRLTERFVADLTRAEAPAGLIKVAGGFHRLDDHALRTMDAAAAAHLATGAPIAVHLELGTAAAEVADHLLARGVPASSIVLGHLGRSPDGRTHLDVAERGVFLAFDGPSRRHHATDWRLLDALGALVDAGHVDRLLLGADTAVRSQRAVDGDGPGAPYLAGVLRDRVERELGADVARSVFVENPARAFTADWRAL